MAFVSFTKKGMSAKKFQRQLKQKRYEPVWALMHKMRTGMRKRDALYDLKDIVAFDEGYFVIESTPKKKSETKAGRGSTSVQNVAVIAEWIAMENVETGKESNQCKYFKMQVLTTHKAPEINEVVQNNIDVNSILF